MYAYVRMYNCTTKGQIALGPQQENKTYKLRRSISMIITFCLQIRERFKKRVRMVHPVASDGTSAYKRQSEIKDSSGVIFLRKIDLKTNSTGALDKTTF